MIDFAIIDAELAELGVSDEAIEEMRARAAKPIDLVSVDHALEELGSASLVPRAMLDPEAGAEVEAMDDSFESLEDFVLEDDGMTTIFSDEEVEEIKRLSSAPPPPSGSARLANSPPPLPGSMTPPSDVDPHGVLAHPGSDEPQKHN